MSPPATPLGCAARIGAFIPLLAWALLFLGTVWPATAGESAAPGKDSATASRVRPVIVEQGRIRVHDKRGGFVPDEKLIGAKLVGYNDAGIPALFRIDSIMRYRDSVVDMWMYAFAARDSAGNWVNACDPDRYGRRRGFALPGYFDATGRYVEDSAAYSITCTSGASGKCVLFGYLPWGRAADGTLLKPYYQACGRMVRADYCGDGRPHTQNGTLIEIWDHKGIQMDTHEPGLSFEASWGVSGAVWLKKTRINAVATLEDIAGECPTDYARMRVPSDTTAAGTALLFNRSR